MTFGLGPATKIFIALEPVDMRKGFEGLHGLVSDRLGEDPLSGHLFLFTNRARTRLKALAWDGSGLWVCAKRLERGSLLRYRVSKIGPTYTPFFVIPYILFACCHITTDSGSHDPGRRR